MPETFKCPSCAAPLEYEGGTTQKCPFCEGTVIVPPELFESAHGRIQIGAALPGMSDTIRQVIALSRSGKKIDAIKLFREKYGVDLRQAKDAAEALERGEAVHFTSTNVRTLTDGDLQTAKKVGKTIGGSMLLMGGLILLITVAFIGGVFYFVFGSVNKAVSKTADKVTATAPQDVQELLRIGGDGTGVGKFKDNRVVAVDGSGRIYSGDYFGDRIQVFDQSGQFVTQWRCDADGKLRSLAANREGKVYMSDSQNLFEYDGGTGKLLKKLSATPVNGLAITADGNLIAATREGYTVFDGDLKQISTQKGAAQSADTKFGFTNVAVSGNGLIYLTEHRTGDVCKFSRDGKFLTRFPSGISTGEGIAVDSSGRVFVSSVSKIHVFDESGKVLHSFDTKQTFGMAFNDKDELFATSRPYIVKYKLAF